MAYEESLKSISLDADASLAGYTGISGQPGAASPVYGVGLFRFVKVTGAHQVGKATAQADNIIGVCQNKPQVTGAATTVGIYGVTMLLSGAAIAAGDKVTSDAQGRGVVAASGAFQATALASAAAAGHLIPVLLQL